MLFPHTSSRRVVLRPATAEDGMAFYKTLLNAGLESLGSIAQNFASFEADAMFLATRRDGKVLGFSTLQGLDQAGHIRSGIYLDPKQAKFGIGSEVTHLTINYAFAAFAIDSMIVQTTEASFASFGIAADGGDDIENVLEEHLYFRGRLWDLHSYRVGRADWESYVDATLEWSSRQFAVLEESMSWRRPPS